MPPPPLLLYACNTYRVAWHVSSVWREIGMVFVRSIGSISRRRGHDGRVSVWRGGGCAWWSLWGGGHWSRLRRLRGQLGLWLRWLLRLGRKSWSSRQRGRTEGRIFQRQHKSNEKETCLNRCSYYVHKGLFTHLFFVLLSFWHSVQLLRFRARMNNYF